MSDKHLPLTESIRELARFWATHEVTDFEDELEEASEPAFERAAAITILLNQNASDAIDAIAKNEGIPAVQLIHRWVMERVRAVEDRVR